MSLPFPAVPVQRHKVAQQVAESLRDAILTRVLDAGDALPSERDLAEQYGVNRASVREAVQRLEAWGLVEVRQGGATRVTDVLRNAGLQLLPFLLAPKGRLDPGILADLLDVRTAILGITASRAARRGDAAAIEEVARAVERLATAATPEERQVLDYAFFEALAVASGNRVLQMIGRAVKEVYLQNRVLFLAMYQVPPFHTGHHQALVEALRAGDEARAGVEMEAWGRRAG